ncbi:MAG TPA: preprotein translocase subunit SecE [Thermosynergistes sp.]|nr:preprotein translocase subunit SecE [Thermosynergistes sp.]
MKKLMAFIREARAELKKVTWPSRQQVWYSTLIVIGVTLLVAAYLGVIDAVLTAFFSKVMKLR